MFRHYDDTQKFLEEHFELVCEETANYLVVWCIDLEMEEVNENCSLNKKQNKTMIRFLFFFCFRNIILCNMLVIKLWSCNLFSN